MRDHQVKSCVSLPDIKNAPEAGCLSAGGGGYEYSNLDRDHDQAEAVVGKDKDGLRETLVLGHIFWRSGQLDCFTRFKDHEARQVAKVIVAVILIQPGPMFGQNPQPSSGCD